MSIRLLVGFVSLMLVCSINGSSEADEIFSKVVTVHGQAVDEDANPIAGAEIFLASCYATYELLAKTTTDDQGRYRFEKIELPVKPPEDTSSIASGRFEVFGMAKGYAFAWRGQKRVYPIEVPTFGGGPKNDDGQFAFSGDDPIEQDLVFTEPVPFSGQIVDENGKGIAQAKVTLFNAEPMHAGGYDKSSDFFVSGDSDFTVLYLSRIVPPKIRHRLTDNQGRFKFDNVPPNTKFRIFVKPGGYATRGIFASTSSKDQIRFEDREIHYSGMRLEFEKHRACEVTVVYGDSGKPAKNVFVELSSKKGSRSAVTNEKGTVNLGLPPGEYRVGYLVEYGTPYISRYSVASILNHEILPGKQKSTLTIKLELAATLEIEVVDAHVGRPVADVDFWVSKGDGREDYFWRSWKPPRTSMVDRPKTPRDGKVKIYLIPGDYEIGAGYRNMPDRYLTPESGEKVSLKAGETKSIKLELKRRGVRETNQ